MRNRLNVKDTVLPVNTMNNFNLQVRCFKIVKLLNIFLIKVVLHFNINAIPNER